MRIYLITLFLFIYFTVQWSDSLGQTQDSTYQWARLSNIENKFRSLGIRTNFNNDIFSFCWYIDSIYIEDTAFIHLGGYPNHQDFNVALVKRDYQGNFIKACDFFTPQNKSIWFVDVEIDKESNILVFGSFSDTLYIDNKRITVSDNQGRNLFLVKLDSDFNFIWGNTISSPYQDECGNIDISEDNYYYLTANHMHPGSDTVSRLAYYLGQDSAYVDDGLNSLLKIDKDGMIIWRKEIHDDNCGHSDGRNTVVGQDNNIYIVGSSTTDIIIEGDTLNHPTYPDYCNCGYIVQFDPEGGHHNSLFLDTHLCTYYYQLEVDHNSDYYLSGIFYQSLILGNDTIYLTGDTTGYIILKMDSSSQLKWYECIKVNTSSSQVSPNFKIDLWGDSLAFAFSTTRSFTFADIDFDFGYTEEVLAGIFEPDGELSSYQYTNSTIGSKVFWMKVDNCGNLIFDGNFRGTAYYGNDTLVSTNPYSLYLVKTGRVQQPILDMPSDTVGCGAITLYAPDGYLYYKWNDELLNQNWFGVNNTGIVNLKATNEDGCWAECEIMVDIFPNIEFSLGNDTTVLLTDTLKINVAGDYESYSWSTGDTSSNLTLPASDLDIGTNIIWLKIDNGPCSASDSIMVEVIDNSFIQENLISDVLIYPNPASTYFNILSRTNNIPESIVIYDCYGNVMMKSNSIDKQIDIEGIKPGLYIVELVHNSISFRRKLIIQ